MPNHTPTHTHLSTSPNACLTTCPNACLSTCRNTFLHTCSSSSKPLSKHLSRHMPVTACLCTCLCTCLNTCLNTCPLTADTRDRETALGCRPTAHTRRNGPRPPPGYPKDILVVARFTQSLSSRCVGHGSPMGTGRGLNPGSLPTPGGQHYEIIPGTVSPRL